MKKRTYSETEQLADDLLKRIGFLQRRLQAKQLEYCAEADAIDEKYAHSFKEFHDAIGQKVKDLKALMKKEKALFFKDADIVSLMNGSLLHHKEDHVTIPKTALEKAEAQGLTDAYKVVNSIDRGAIEKWTDERLVLIGATRKPKETFNYEVKTQ